MEFNKRSKFTIWVLVVALLNLLLVSAAGAAFNDTLADSDGVLASIKVSTCFSDMKEGNHTFQHEKQDCQSGAVNDACSTCVYLQATIPVASSIVTVIPERLQSGQPEKLITLFTPPNPRPPTTYLI